MVLSFQVMDDQELESEISNPDSKTHSDGTEDMVRALGESEVGKENQFSIQPLPSCKSLLSGFLKFIPVMSLFTKEFLSPVSWQRERENKSLAAILILISIHMSRNRWPFFENFISTN